MRKVLVCSVIYILMNTSLFGQCSNCNYKSDEIRLIENKGHMLFSQHFLKC